MPISRRIRLARCEDLFNGRTTYRDNNQEADYHREAEEKHGCHCLIRAKLSLCSGHLMERSLLDVSLTDLTCTCAFKIDHFFVRLRLASEEKIQLSLLISPPTPSYLHSTHTVHTSPIESLYRFLKNVKFSPKVKGISTPGFATP